MKNKINKKIAAIMILPVFLATSFEPLWAAELVVGAGGQVQSVVSPDQVPAADALSVEQAPEDLFETAGALSAPTSEANNVAAAIPEGWSAVASNSNFAFKVDNQINPVTHNNVWTLKLLNLGTSEEKVVNVQNSWPSDPFETDVDVSPDGSTVIYKVSYGSAVNKVVLQNISNSALKLELEGQRVDPILYSDTAVHIVVQRTVRYGSPVRVYTGVTLSDLKIYNTKYLFINPGSDVRVDNDRPYVTQLVRNPYSNTWTLYVYHAPDGTNNWLNLIHSQTLYTGQAGGSSTLTHLDVVRNANGQDILNLSIDSTQTDANLSINLTLLQIVVPAGVTIPGTLVNMVEDDRVAVYIYRDAKGKQQAVIYDKVTHKVISKTQRVNVGTNEQVLFFDAPKVDNPPGRGYILHLDGATQQLTHSNMGAGQIYLTPNEGQIIFIAVQADGDSTFGIYQLRNKSLYMHNISNQWGLGAKIIWNQPSNHYAAVSVGSQGHILFIPLPTKDKEPFKPETWVYNRDYDVVRLPDFVKGDVATISFNLAQKTAKAVTRGGDHLLFNISANGNVWLSQAESWNYSGNVVREYTKVTFGVDGKRNSLSVIQYDARGRISYTRDVFYDAKGKVKRVIAYRYTIIRGRIVKVAV